jgi:nicotinamide-nucleotide amidase
MTAQDSSMMLLVRALAARVGTNFKAREWTLATAESCTGGWIAKIRTDIAGSSAWFDRGFVTYSNASKMEMLGVQEGILSAFGAVSAETVVAMTQGALARSHADVAVAVSGIAGPEGGAPDKPVGTVWLGWAVRGQHVRRQRYVFSGDRESVRIQSVAAALKVVLDIV